MYMYDSLVQLVGAELVRKHIFLVFLPLFGDLLHIYICLCQHILRHSIDDTVIVFTVSASLGAIHQTIKMSAEHLKGSMQI